MMQRHLMAAATAVILSLVSGSATASDWRIIGKEPHSSTDIDAASLRRSGDIVYAWTRTVFDAKQHTHDGKVYLSKRELLQLNCVERRLAIEDQTFFATVTFDNEVDSAEFPDYALEWHAVVPDSRGEGLLDFVCKAAK